VRRRGEARLVALLASIGAASALLGILAFHAGTTAQGYSFSSRLPVVTPATVVAAVGLVTLLARSGRQGDRGELLPVAAACFASVLFLTNQQLVSGRMISTRDWERSVDYPLVFLGAAMTRAIEAVEARGLREVALLLDDPSSTSSCRPVSSAASIGRSKTGVRSSGKDPPLMNMHAYLQAPSAGGGGRRVRGLRVCWTPDMSLPSTTTETAAFHSFDGSLVERAAFCRPDRYRMVEAAIGADRVIARGGGYSYAAASFGGGSLVLDMTRLDRVLRFEPQSRLIEVEAGMRLEQLLALTAPRGLILPVQPGYPAITVGGCVASNVHGKNPHREGTFRHSVVDLTLSHPRLGTLRIDRSTEPELFELTCGGYGLTGVVLAATLRLEPLLGWTASVERIPIESMAEGLARVRERTEGAAFAYTWHEGIPSAGAFGRGLVYVGQIAEGPLPRERVVPGYRRLTARSRARLGAPLWGRSTSRLLGTGFRALEGLRPRRSEMPLFDALFPFARRGEYFLLYGRRGLAEYQSLVPHAAAASFVAELEREVRRVRPPLVMASLKLFRGEKRFVRFEADGVCFTFDLVRSSETRAFLERLDRITLEASGLPHIVKDSRLPAEVVARSYEGYEEFRAKRRAHDPEGRFRSALSARLEL